MCTFYLKLTENGKFKVRSYVKQIGQPMLHLICVIATLFITSNLYQFIDKDYSIRLE